ncbi:MAG TPA: 5'-methylthioadenosine/S-adenosylhomocysteine nucleosidase [Opitutus sp.]|nr:5'-methylthioadenosine/S-adenosylhomocysteine nucleosidase [Opitutus sp.]
MLKPNRGTAFARVREHVAMRFPSVLLRVLTLFAALGVALARSAPTANVDLLLVAGEDEALAPVLRRLSGAQAETHAAWTFWVGELAGKRVVVARADGDPLNAVAVTTLALRRHPPRLVFVFGTARPHDPALHDGDVVVATGFAAFDGIESPVVPLGGGSDALTWQRLPHLLMTSGETELPVFTFPADPAAITVALALAAPHGRVLRGVLGSANQINREADRIAWLHTHWGTSTEDGESAAIAGCAALFGVPVTGARVVSGSPADAAAFALKFVEAWK